METPSADLCPTCDGWRREGSFARFGRQPIPIIEPASPTNDRWGEYELSQLRSNHSCAFCRFLIRILARDSSYPFIQDARVQIIHECFAVHSDGKVAHPVFRLALLVYVDNDSEEETAEEESAVEVDFNSGVGGYEPQMPYELPSPTIQLIAREDSTLIESHGQNESRLLLGRRVTSQVDIRLAKEWLEKCSMEHGDSCSSESNQGAPPQFKVIDIKERRVVHAPTACAYAALSYVWGTAGNQLTLTEDTKRTLMSVGALADSNQHLPLTIKDSILLCEKLGIDFLWVDALCIQQDSPDDLEQVNYMDSVYGAAMLTIVAATGSGSWSGLAGVRENSRRNPQEVLEIYGMTLASCQTPTAKLIKHCKWKQRGWTLQENFLSQRLLVFGEDQMFWLCNSVQWREDTHLETQNRGGFAEENIDYHITPHATKRLEKSNLGNLERPKEAFKRYLMLVEDYTGRALTNSGDAIRAFTGILKALEVPMDTGFFFGLPTSFFDVALLSGPSIFRPAARRPDFPTWSWAGWKNSEPGAGLRHKVLERDFEEFRASVLFFKVKQHDNIWGLERILSKSGRSYLLPHGNIEAKDTMETTFQNCLDSWNREIVPLIVLHSEFSLDYQQVLLFETTYMPVVLEKPDYIIPNRSRNFIVYGHSTDDFGMRTTISMSAFGRPYVTLDASWESQVGHDLHLLYIAFSLRNEQAILGNEPSVYVMLVETDTNNISRRIACPPWTVPLTIWESTHPETKVFFLA